MKDVQQLAKDYYTQKYQFTCKGCGFPMEIDAYCDECKSKSTQIMLDGGAE